MSKDELFKKLKSEHNDWSDEQIWTQVSVMLSAEDTITKQGPNVSLSEDLLRLILEKAKDWLRNKLPEIFEKVVNFFDDLIDRLPQWAKKGLSFVFKVIIRYFSATDYSDDYYSID